MLGGNLTKMRVENANPVRYFLRLSDEEVALNQFIGKNISLSFNGQINCVACGRLTKKSFSQGFCFPCMQNSPQNSECIIRPELCEAHLGKGRDPEWEKRNHLVPHTVYLALSSGLKVGVTRNGQIPTRWIDQGARSAIRLAEVPNRYLAGKIEVHLKDHLNDKTAWQRMLKNEVEERDLLDEKTRVADLLSDELKQYVSEDNVQIDLDYPVLDYPEKVKSLNFDKMPEISGLLKGMKGQYLIFEGGNVLNIRRHSGYFVNFRSGA